MDVKTLLGLTSAVVGAGIVVGQDPSFEYPGVQPILTSGKVIPALDAEIQDKKISVQFKQASVEAVLDWLSNQGVSFVTAGIPKDAKINLSVTDISLTEVIDVIGESLGGSFVKRGNTYIFQKGTRNFVFESPITQLREVPIEMHNLKALEEVKALQGHQFAMPEGFTIKMLDSQDPKSQKEMQQFREKMLKEFGPNSDFMKKLQKEMGDTKKWESLHKDMAKQHEHSAKLHEEMMRKFGEGSAFQKEMRGFSEQDAKRMEDLGKEMERRFGEGSAFQKEMKTFGTQDAKKWEEFGKSMEKRFGQGSEFEKGMKAWGEKYGKEMESQFGPGSKFSKEMKAFKLEDGKMRELSAKEHEQMMKELQGKMKNLKDFKMPAMPKMPDMPKMEGREFMMPPMPSTSFQSGDILGVAKGLSPTQREKNKKQGFLYWSDLNKDQQSKIGAQGWTGNWTITINRDGESFTLKSDKK